MSWIRLFEFVPNDDGDADEKGKGSISDDAVYVRRWSVLSVTTLIISILYNACFCFFFFYHDQACQIIATVVDRIKSYCII